MRPPSSCYFLVKVLSGAMQWTYKTPTYMWYKPRFCMTKNIAGTIQLPISPHTQLEGDKLTVYPDGPSMQTRIIPMGMPNRQKRHSKDELQAVLVQWAISLLSWRKGVLGENWSRNPV